MVRRMSRHNFAWLILGVVAPQPEIALPTLKEGVARVGTVAGVTKGTTTAQTPNSITNIVLGANDTATNYNFVEGAIPLSGFKVSFLFASRDIQQIFNSQVTAVPSAPAVNITNVTPNPIFLAGETSVSVSGTGDPGATVTLLKQDTGSIVVDVSSDPSALKTKLENVVTAYNDIVKFITDQNAASAKGDQASLGRDALLRGLKGAMRSVLSAQYDLGGSFSYLSQIGIEMTTAGTMRLSQSKFNDAVSGGTDQVALLLAGTATEDGAFVALQDMLESYTKSNGFVKSAQDQINEQITRLGTQVETMQQRLALRRAALQTEFTAADIAMTRLRAQSGSLSGVGF